MVSGVPRMCISTSPAPRGGHGVRHLGIRQPGDVVDDVRARRQRLARHRRLARIHRDRQRPARRGSPAPRAPPAPPPRPPRPPARRAAWTRRPRPPGPRPPPPSAAPARSRPPDRRTVPPSLKLSGVTFRMPITTGRSRSSAPRRSSQRPVVSAECRVPECRVEARRTSVASPSALGTRYSALVVSIPRTYRKQKREGKPSLAFAPRIQRTYVPLVPRTLVLALTPAAASAPAWAASPARERAS